MEHAANWAYLATPAIIPSRKKPPELAIGNKDKNGLVPGGEAISYLHAHQFQTTAAEGGGGGDGNTGSSRSRTGSGRATAEESHGGAVLPVPDAVSFSSFFRFMAGTIPESGQILGVQRERRLDKGKDMSKKNDDEDQSGGDGGSTKTTARGPVSPRVIEEQSRARGRDKKRGSSRDVASHRVRTPAVDADDGATPFSPHRRGDDVLKHRQGTDPVDWDRDGVETGSSPMASTMGSISTGTGTGTGTGANASASASVRTSTTAISQRGKEAEAVATAECSNADDGCKSTEKGGGAQGSAGTTNDPSRGSSFARARARPPVDSIAAFVLASGGRAAAVRRRGGGGGAAAAAAATGASAAASASPAVRAAPQAVPPAVLSAVPGRTTTVGRQPRPPTTPSLPASSRSPAKKRDHDPPPLHQQQQHQQQQPYHRRSPPSPHHHHRNHIHTRAPSLSSSFPTSFSSSLALSWSSSLVAGPPTAAATATTGAAVALANSPPCDTETETETHFKRHPPVLVHAAAQNPPNRHVGGGHGHRLTRQLHNTHQHHQVPSTSTASSTRTHRTHVPRSPLATPPVSSSSSPPPPPSPALVASASGTAVVFSSASLPGTGHCYQPSPDTSTTTTTNTTTSTDLLTAETTLPANTTSTTTAAAAACVSIRRVTTTQATAYPHLRFHSPTTTTAPAKSEQPPRAPPPLITSPRLFPPRHAAAAAMTPDEQYRADSVSSASVTTHSNVGVMTSSDTLPPSSTEGSIAASNASTSAKPRLAVGPKPLVIRNNRTYISDANLAYPLPVDLAELHRQSLRTLLLFQLFGGPITSPAFAAKPPARVLEVGCGSGFWSMMCHRYFDQHGHGSISFTGLDIVPLCGSGLDPNSKPDKDMRWRFVQHDMRRTPWPLDDGEFDLVMVKDMSFAGPGQIAQRFMDEYLRVLRPGGVLEVWDSDHTIRMLRPHAPPNRAPGATVEEADEDEDDEDEDEEEDSSDDNEEGSESDNGDEDHVSRLGAYPVTGNTPLSTPLNPFLVEYNGWLSKALDARALSAVPCTMTGPALLQEDGLGDVRSKRLAIPLSEVRWEREGVGGVVTKDGKTYIDSQKGKTKVGDTKAARGGKSLTLAQAAVRRTALETCVGMIQALEPLLRESSGKSQDEWDGWVGKMINDLLQQGGTSWGECLEIGAWTARKRK